MRLSIILSFLLLTSLSAFSKSELGSLNIKSIEFEDGNIASSTDIKEIIFGLEAIIDSVELESGIIYYDTEITEVLLDHNKIDSKLDSIQKLENGGFLIFGAAGGDGSGGG